MVTEREQLDKIRSLLKFHPRGLTISEISQRLKINRNSVSKYLEILQISGHVDMRALGAAKVYYLAQRIPLATILGFTKEGILVINSDGRILQVNERFCSMFSLTQSEILSSQIMDLPPYFTDIISKNLLFPSMEDSSEKSRIVRIEQYDWTRFFKVRILNTIFDTGDHGKTIIIEDITLEKEMEERIHLNEARYRGIVEDQTEMICRFTPRGKITFANEAYCRIFSLQPNQISSASVSEFLSEKKAEELLQAMESVTQDKPVWEMEHEINLPSGDQIWTHWLYRSIFRESGHLIEFQGVGHDISEKKRAEIELYIKSCAIDSSLIPICLTNLDGIISYANPAFLQLWGYYQDHDVIGLPIEHFSHGNLDSLTTLFKLKQEISKGLGFSGELRGNKKDGTGFVALISFSIVSDAQNKPLCIIGYFNDVTERVKMTREMLIRENAITHSNEGILIISPDNNISYVNPAFGMIFPRVSGKKLVSSPFSVILESYPQIDSLHETIQKNLQENKSWRGIISDISESGKTTIAELHFSVTFDRDGNELCTILSALDITEQRMVEESLSITYQHLEQAIDYLGEPTFIIGNEGRIIAWNGAMASLTGKSASMMIGTRNYREAFHMFEPYIPVLADLIELSVKDLVLGYPQVSRIGNGLFTQAFVPKLNNGAGALIWAKAYSIHDKAGKPIGIIQTFKDMTNWKKAVETGTRVNPK